MRIYWPQKLMKRSTMFLSYLSLTCLLLGCGTRAGEKVKEDTSKPNFVYILADDLGYGDLSCYGQQRFQTPHIDALAASGLRFLSHYSGSTVCAPSRSALMTGMHTGHTPVRGNKEVKPEGQWPLPAETFTLPEMLKEQGYVTGAFGKWGLGYPGSEGDPNHQGFDEFYGYNCQRIAHHYYPWHLWHNQEKVVLDQNAGSEAGNYAPIDIHRKALDFIQRNRDTAFFLFIPSPIPHAELFAPEEYLARFRGKLLPEKKYEGVDAGAENFRNGPYGSQEECHAAFAAMVALLDDQVGEINAKLQDLGLAENTLVIFSSDNGPHLEGGADPDYFDSNGRLTGYKRDLYEGGIRVPTIAAWPGMINPGLTTEHPSAFWDVMPTFAEILDVPSAQNIDGVSFLPTLLGKGTQVSHDYLYWEFHERGGRQALRKGDWKLVLYDINKTPPGKPQLYNLAEDLGESHDLAARSPEKVDELLKLITTARTESPVYNFSATAYDAEKK